MLLILTRLRSNSCKLWAKVYFTPGANIGEKNKLQILRSWVLKSCKSGIKWVAFISSPNARWDCSQSSSRMERLGVHSSLLAAPSKSSCMRHSAACCGGVRCWQWLGRGNCGWLFLWSTFPSHDEFVFRSIWCFFSIFNFPRILKFHRSG